MLQARRKLLLTVAILALVTGGLQTACGGAPLKLASDALARVRLGSALSGVSGKPQGKPVAGNWVFLSDLAWQRGTTGWVAMAGDDLPALDNSFQGGPLSIGGAGYLKGIGVYPLSEISYALDGQYTLFDSDFGLNDLSTGDGGDAQGGVIFMVYLDGALVFDSGVVRRGQAPGNVQLQLAGVRELRLVVSAAGQPATDSFADWAGARLLRPTQGPDEAKIAATLDPLRTQLSELASQREEERQALAVLAADEIQGATPLMQAATAVRSTTMIVADPSRQSIVLWSGSLLLRYGFGGDDHGLLTVLHLPTKRLILNRADASVDVAPELRLSLHHDTIRAGDGSFAISEVEDPVFGPGTRADVFLISRDGAAHLTMTLTLFERGPYFTQQITVTKSPVPPASPRINHFDWMGPSNLALGDGLRYLTDISRIRKASVPDDGIQRRETVDQGKPVFLTESGGLGLLIAALDETEGPIDFESQVDPGRVTGHLGVATGSTVKAKGTAITGPRLYVEVTATTEPKRAFQNFRRSFAQLYPALPLPEWVRYQWLSWYTYYMNIDENVLRQQIDYIAENLGDLGPWHIIVDAGWYVAEGRPDAEWRNVDRTKFPSGLRALVDYAHSRDVKVVLYFSAPYLDTREQPFDWLGLRRIVEEHRDWLIQIGEDDTHQSYVYDFNNPSLREYMANVLHDYFVSYDVDGIKIDGLGNAEGAVLTAGERDAFGLVDRVKQPAMEIYRFVRDQAVGLKKDVYIESGWLTPLFANELAHTFRYGDEGMGFSNRYPQPGLLEHIDYAVAQQALWGQRANMGAVYADPNTGPLNRKWLQAALALGAQSALSFDLTTMTAETLSRYRSLLVNFRPFAGTTYYGTTPEVDSFATTVDGLTFLGVLNRGSAPLSVSLPLADYGLSNQAQYAAYDVDEASFGTVDKSIAVKLEPRSLRLYVLRGDPGVVWTNSSYSVEDSTSRSTSLVVRGATKVGGFIQLFVPGLNAVAMDGRPLSLGDKTEDGSDSYDKDMGILTLFYEHDEPHHIAVEYEERR